MTSLLPSLFAVAVSAAVLVAMHVVPAEVYPWFREGALVEDVQALAWFGAACGLLLLLRRERHARWPLALLLLATLVIWGEEISWGQRILGFDPPQFMVEANRQGEFTLHNLGPLQNVRHGFLLFAGLLGSCGVLCRSRLARAIPALGPLLPGPALLPVFLLVLLGVFVMTRGWLWFDARPLGLPPAAPGRFVSETLELFLAASWCGLVWRAVVRGGRVSAPRRSPDASG